MQTERGWKAPYALSFLCLHLSHILPLPEEMLFQCQPPTGAGQIPGVAQEQGDTKQCYGEWEQGYTMWVFQIRRNWKRSTSPGSLLDKSGKMTFSELTWGNFGSGAQISLSFTFLKAGNRNILAVCVPDNFQSQVARSNQSSQLLGPSSSQRGRSDRGLWSAGCGTSPPLRAPNSTVSLWAHTLHSDCT